MSVHSFAEDLKKRKFFREIFIYAVASWLIIQVAAVAHDYIGVPKYMVTLVIIGFLLGLPFFMLYAWRHDVMSKIKGPNDDSDQIDELNSSSISKKLFYRLLGVTSIVVIVSSGFILKENFLEVRKSQLKHDDRVAISIFENNTGEKKYDNIGKIISDYLTRGITSTNFANVVSYATISRQTTQLAGFQSNVKLSSSIIQNTGASKIIEGGYHIEKGRLIIHSHIVDGTSGEIIYSLKPIRCDKEAPSECISEMEQLILGFWFSQIRDPDLQITPKYDAYVLYLEALEIYNQDYEKSLELADRAISIDSNFIQPYFLKASIYYDLNEYEKLKDQIEDLRDRGFGLNEREKNLIRFYDGLYDGDYVNALNAFKQEYKYHPNEMHTNTSLMVAYMNLVNMPNQTIKVHSDYDGKSIDFNDCYYCQTRTSMMAKALIKIGKADEALEVLNSLPSQNLKRILFQTKIKAAAQANRYDLIDNILKDPVIFELERDYRYLFYIACHESAVMGNKDKTKEYGLKAIKEYESSESSNYVTKGRIYYLMEDWDKADYYFTKYLEDHPNDISSNAKKAAILIKKGENEKAGILMESIKSFQDERYKGEKFYQLGSLYALLNDSQSSILYLQRALQNGHIFYPSYFDGDPDLVNNLSKEDLDSVLNYYHDRIK